MTPDGWRLTADAGACRLLKDCMCEGATSVLLAHSHPSYPSLPEGIAALKARPACSLPALCPRYASPCVRSTPVLRPLFILFTPAPCPPHSCAPCRPAALCLPLHHVPSGTLCSAADEGHCAFAPTARYQRHLPASSARVPQPRRHSAAAPMAACFVACLFVWNGYINTMYSIANEV